MRNRQGDLAEAARLHLDALARFRRLDDAYRVADALNRAANDRYAQGQIKAALELHRESLAAYEGIGHRFGVGVASYGIAADLLALGAPEEAEGLYRAALTVFEVLGNRMFSAEARRGLAEAEVARGDLSSARSHLETAVAELSVQSEPEIERNVRLLLARIDLEEDRAAEAERSLRQLLSAPDRLDADTEAAYRELLAQALLAQGRSEEARASCRRALALTERTQRDVLRLGIEITAARVTAAVGDAAAAGADLMTVAERAGELDLPSLRLEAELQLGKLLARGDRSPRARSALAAVAREAEARGLALLARKATPPSRRSPRARDGRPS